MTKSKTRMAVAAAILAKESLGCQNGAIGGANLASFKWLKLARGLFLAFLELILLIFIPNPG